VNAERNLLHRNERIVMRVVPGIALAGIAALLAGCGGGAGSAAAPAVAQQTGAPTSPAQSSTHGTLAVVVNPGVKSSTTHRFAKQITTDVAGVALTVNGAVTSYAANSAACSGSGYVAGASFTCTVQVPLGNDTVSVATTTGAASPVGYAVPQTVAVTAGTTATVQFNITPVASSLALNAPAITLPEDGASHTETATADVLAPNGAAISAPIDTANLFGTVAVTSGDAADLTASVATQTPGSYNDAVALAYDGQYVSGDAVALSEAYTANPAATASGAFGGVGTSYSATPPAIAQATLTIALARLALPPAAFPTGATLGGSTYDAATGAYYIAPTSATANAGNSAVVQFNGSGTGSYGVSVHSINDASQLATTAADGVISGLNHCTAGVTVGTTTGGVTPVALTNVPGGSSCTVTLVSSAFPTLSQTIQVTPSGAAAVHVSSKKRNV
jgi:hypothetical protein